MRNNYDDNEDELETVDNLDEIIQVTPQANIPVDYVCIPLDLFQTMDAFMQRVRILVERIQAGEKLDKERLLRALGFFDEATEERLWRGK